MRSKSEPKTAHDRAIRLHVGERSLAPRVAHALRSLGYSLVENEPQANACLDADSSGPADTGSNARVWLVDADQLDSLPDANEAPDLRVLLISSPRQRHDGDRRVFAQTTRPGRLGPVYAMIQSALEETPRRSPRIETRLSARCIRADRRSIGAVLSLSEGGCLLRSGEEFRQGAKVSLQFALPDYGLVSTRAECRYIRSSGVGLAFTKPSADIRHTIAHYITRKLAGQPHPQALESAQTA